MTTEQIHRPMPHAEEAEKAILSNLIGDDCSTGERDELFEKIESNKITPEFFHLPSHATLFKAVQEQRKAGKPTDLASLHAALQSKGLIDMIGGASTLVTITNASFTSAYFEHHLELIRDKFLLRSIIRQSMETLENAYSNPESVSEFVAKTEDSLSRLKEGVNRSDNFVGLDTLAGEWLESWTGRQKGELESTKISTGFPNLDRALNGGIGRGWSVVITGKTGGGKSAFASSLVANFMRQQKSCYFVSAEMTQGEVWERLLSNLAQVSCDFVQEPPEELNATHKHDLAKIKDSIQQAGNGELGKLFVSDKAGKIEEVAASAQAISRKHGLDLIVLDYLQLIQPSEFRGVSRERQIAHISNVAKTTAMRLDCAVLCLAQLNDDGHTRESKAIEHDANLWLSVDKDTGVGVNKVRGSRTPKESFSLTLDGEFMTFR